MDRHVKSAEAINVERNPLTDAAIAAILFRLAGDLTRRDGRSRHF